MSSVQRVWLGVLLLFATGVAAAAVYVVHHSDPVQDAGTTPGYSAAASSEVVVAPTITATATGTPTSTGPSAARGSGTTVAPAVRVAFLGDDYTVGDGASTASKSWTRLVARSLNLSAVDVGGSGAGYAKQSSGRKTYASLVSAVVAAEPEVIVVSGGRNDVADDADTLMTATKALFAELHSKIPDATLIAIAPWWGDSAQPPELSPVEAAVKSGVESVGGTYLDESDPLRGHANWMADAGNPNDKGYRAIADAVAPAIEQQLPG